MSAGISWDARGTVVGTGEAAARREKPSLARLPSGRGAGSVRRGGRPCCRRAWAVTVAVLALLLQIPLVPPSGAETALDYMGRRILRDHPDIIREFSDRSGRIRPATREDLGLEEEPPRPPAGTLIAEGRLRIPAGQVADLDTGRVGIFEIGNPESVPGADIFFQAPRRLGVLFGMIVPGGGRNPSGYSGCRRLLEGLPVRSPADRRRYAFVTLPNDDRAFGRHYCAVNFVGNIAELRYLGIPRGSQLVIDYRLWSGGGTR